MERFLHQIWVGPYQMPERESRFVANIRQACKAAQVRYQLWTDENLPDMPSAVRERYDFFGKSKDYAFQADVLRVLVVQLVGGLYLDVDSELRGPLPESLWQTAGYLVHNGEEDLTIPNGMFGLDRGALADHLVAQITPDQWWFGPAWLGASVRSFFKLPPMATHAELQDSLINISYTPFTQWASSFTNWQLYSWAPENKARFASGVFKSKPQISILRRDLQRVECVKPRLRPRKSL